MTGHDRSDQCISILHSTLDRIHTNYVLRQLNLKNIPKTTAQQRFLAMHPNKENGKQVRVEKVDEATFKVVTKRKSKEDVALLRKGNTPCNEQTCKVTCQKCPSGSPCAHHLICSCHDSTYHNMCCHMHEVAMSGLLESRADQSSAKDVSVDGDLQELLVPHVSIELEDDAVVELHESETHAQEKESGESALNIRNDITELMKKIDKVMKKLPPPGKNAKADNFVEELHAVLKGLEIPSVMDVAEKATSKGRPKTALSKALSGFFPTPKKSERRRKLEKEKTLTGNTLWEPALKEAMRKGVSEPLWAEICSSLTEQDIETHTDKWKPREQKRARKAFEEAKKCWECAKCQSFEWRNMANGYIECDGE